MSFWRPDIDPDHEPHKVLIKRDELADPTRENRVVPFKVYYPVAHSLDHLPVILWSHGLGGSRDGAAFLARFIASHGYVVVNVQHPGTDTSLWEGKPGHPWDVIRATPIPRHATLNRMRDIPFILARLPGWAEAHPDIARHMDMSRMGMSGHSFGALTTQVMAGQGCPDESGKLVSLKEERFLAGILYSPVPVRHLTDEPSEKVFGSITLPLLHMTGTHDKSPIENFGYRERLVVYENAHRAPQELLVLDAADHMVFAGSRGQLAETALRKKHEAHIKVISFAYWDAMLRQDKKARDWLNGAGVQDYIKGSGFYSHKPGEYPP